MITPDLDKIKSTLVKVRRLAEDGTDGEKLAAKTKLSELLEKYGVGLSELDEEVIQERELKYKKDPDGKDIMIQVILSVAETTIWVTPKKYMAFAMLNSQQYIEVVEKYKYYWELYKKQRGYFKRAFITKNQLYATNYMKSENDKISTEDDKEITRIQIAIGEGKFETNSPKGLLTNDKK